MKVAITTSINDKYSNLASRKLSQMLQNLQPVLCVSNVFERSAEGRERSDSFSTIATLLAIGSA